jgi:PAS domain S-box-containing protein
MAWREFRKAGIDPFKNFASISFGGTHDDVVYAVRDGKVDAGTVRTDTFERMQTEGRISLDAFHVIHEHGEDKADLPFFHSTRGYPEWPIAKLKHISNEVAENVAIALIAMPADSAAANAARAAGWTIPLNYQPVHECLKELKLGPYKDLGKITVSVVVKKYWIFLLVVAVLFAAVSGTAIFILNLNRNIKETQIELQAEVEERKQAEAALRKSEQEARQYFDVASVGFVALDKEGNITLINKRGLEILGYRQEELIGRNWFKTCLPDKSRKDVLDVFHKLIRGEIEPDEYSKNTVLTKEGKERIISWHNAILRDPGGEITGILSSGKDITEQIQAEQEKVKLEAHLQQAQKMESIGTLAGGIAHDFNNILFPIFGYLEMMSEDVSEDDPLRGKIEEVFNGAKRARDLVQRILTFSRQKDHELKPLKVHLVIKEALKLIKSSLPSTIEISQNIKTDCGLVMADSTQFHQVIMNLCANAFHAMEKTGGKLTVNLKEAELAVEDLKDSAMIPGKYVCMTVADTGTGMDQSITDRIFDPYYTTKEEGKGTGLGLAVVHGIVKSHGGHISVYSEPGKGSEFQILLPVIKKQKESAKVETDTPVQKGDERILLVDDEDMITQMEKQMLERLGYHVTARTGSIDALEAFKANPDRFDLVITDMTMPNMTGEQLAGEIMKIRSDIPVILCTGFSEMISEEKAKSLGIKGFLMKPAVMKDFSNMIRKVLDNT